ncbi:MAG: hypothetical protein ACJ759_21860, partial [Thermoanaerobaculia bacterium]
ALSSTFGRTSEGGSCMTAEQLAGAEREIDVEIGRNRRRLVDLIYSLDSFTPEELIDMFRKESGGSVTIDVQHTLREYLNELSELGVLRFEHGRYSVE